MSDRLCIDLCSGYEGLSAAFKKAGWEVVTVDIDPKFNPTVCMDVKKFTVGILWNLTKHSRPFYRQIVVLAAPPCTYFSRAAGLGMVRDGTGEALRIVAACIDFIYELQPTHFLIENPEGGYLRFFLGTPNQRIKLNVFKYRSVKPTAFWTDLHLPLAPFDTPNSNPDKNTWENGNKDPAVRATMPLGLSQAILEAVAPRNPEHAIRRGDETE